MKYFPHTQQDIEQMLAVAGVKSLDELFGEFFCCNAGHGIGSFVAIHKNYSFWKLR